MLASCEGTSTYPSLLIMTALQISQGILLQRKSGE